jgi:hypothetical protein
MLSMMGGAAPEGPLGPMAPMPTIPEPTATAVAQATTTLALPSPRPTSTPPGTPTGKSTPTSTPQRTPTAAFLPSSTPPGTATAVFSPTPAGETLEVTGDSQVSEADRLGELDVNYPVRMSPGSSDIVRLSIQIPERLVSLAPMSVERVVLSPGSQPAIGEVSSDQATIIIGRVMRVEVSSPTFVVASEYPAVQAVDVETIGSPTFWAWTVVAPDRVGNHILTVRVFLGEETAQPSWMRAYQVEVLEFSPTPAVPSSAATLPASGSSPTLMPTAAPTPTPALSERIKEGVLANVVEILISIVSLLISGMAWLLGVGYRAQKKRTEKIASLQKELAKAAAEEREALAKEIAQLEAVRWWQFCKWGE